MSFGGYDGSIRIDTRIDAKGFNAGIRGITASLRKVAVAVGLAFGLQAIIRFGKTAVDEASALSAAMIGLQSVVTGTGKSFTEAKKFINDYISDGLMPATDAITAYKNLALRGYNTDQIQQTLVALKDSAAFGRQSSLTLGKAVASATEGLKNENSILVDNAGVTKNVSILWKEYAASIGTTVGALTKQQKIQAEVDGILRETRFQLGDAAKLTQTYAGQVSAIGVSFYNLRVAIGNALIPIFSKVIAAIKPVIDWLTALINRFALFISILFGVKIGASDAMGAVAGGAEEAADAQGDLAKNTEKAGKAAKGALAAFDELNVLAQDTGTGAALPGGPGGGGVTLPPIETDQIDESLDAMIAKVQAFKDALLKLLGPAIEAFDRLKESLGRLGATVWEGLKWAWDNILVPLGEWVITEVVPRFFDLLAAAADILNNALIALQPLGIWLWEKFLQPLATWTGGIILQALDWLIERMNALADWIRENPKLFETLVIVFFSLAAAAWILNAAFTAYTVIMGIAATATATFGGVMAIITSPIFLVFLAIAALIAIIILLVRNWDWVKEKAGEVWDWIVAKWTEVARNFQTNFVKPVSESFSKLWEDIKEWAKNAWNWIVTTWQGASTWFKTKVIDPVVTWFSNAGENIKTFFSDAWANVQAIWEVAKDWFQTTVIDPIKDGFSTALDAVKQNWETIFGGIKTFVKGVINGIIDLINGLLMAVAGGLNGIIDNLNKIKIAIPSWVPVYGGEEFGFKIPNVKAPTIPKLATGAVIPPNAAFAAILGDQRAGRNLEAPEALIRQIVREETQGLGSGEIAIRFEGSLGQLVRTLKPVIDRENRRVGSSLIDKGTNR